MADKKDIQRIENEWKTNPRWKGIKRPYTAETVYKLSGSLKIEHTLAQLGAKKLFDSLSKKDNFRTMGALTGNQAVQLVAAGLKSIYVSGWQVAGDANDALQTYPDQSLYPALSVPNLIRRINNALQRADEVQHLENSGSIDWYVPLVVDAEAGFGGPLNVFELVKAMIAAGAAGIHLEDQLSSLKKCGHMGGKVLEPAKLFIEKLITARLATDVMGVPTVLIARTDAEAAGYIRADSDPVDIPFLTGNVSSEGYYEVKSGIEYAVARANAFAPYVDMVWCETSTPDIGAAREFAQGVHAKFPGKWLAYNCSPSFNWGKHLDDKQLARFQDELEALGYNYQFVTLAGFHSLNASMFELAKDYAKNGMAAYGKFQNREFALEKDGYKAIKHQSFVGAGYFDQVTLAVDEKATTTALSGSTEEQQFHPQKVKVK